MLVQVKERLIYTYQGLGLNRIKHFRKKEVSGEESEKKSNANSLTNDLKVNRTKI